jgi:hypothetical protein
MGASDTPPPETRFYGCFVPRLYNQVRPHSALGYLTPAEFAQRSAASSGCARMAPPFEAAPATGDCVVKGVVLGRPNPEKVSLSLD